MDIVENLNIKADEVRENKELCKLLDEASYEIEKLRNDYRKLIGAANEEIEKLMEVLGESAKEYQKLKEENEKLNQELDDRAFERSVDLGRKWGF